MDGVGGWMSRVSLTGWVGWMNGFGVDEEKGRTDLPKGPWPEPYM